MASISKRKDDRADESEPAPWHERPIIGRSPGLPWWQAILLGFGLTLFAAVIDLQFNDTLTVLFQGAYFVACVAAVGWVRRDSLFGPMVQPPLILAVIVPAITVLGGKAQGGSSLKDILLGYGLPVINGFPTMAITAGVTLAIGIARLYFQRDPERATPGKADDDDAPGKAAPARGRRAIPDEDDPDAGPGWRRLPGLSALAGLARKAKPEARPDAADAPDAVAEPARVREPVEPPPGRRAAPRPASPAAPAGRNPSGPTQRPSRPAPPERRREAPGAGPPPPGRRRNPSDPVRRPPAPGEAPDAPRRAQPKPPQGPPPPSGSQPPRRRPAPPPADEPQRPPRRQPPPPRRRHWDPDQG